MDDKSEPATTVLGSPPPIIPAHNVDEAHRFLQEHAHAGSAGYDMARVMKKVDWRLTPSLFFSYFFQALDKQALSYAAVMGMPKDLRLKGDDFSNAATALFVALLVTQVPTAYALNKLPAAKWLAVNSVLWGIATALTAAARNYRWLLAARILMGVFEAAVLPSVTIICSQYYRKDQSGFRFTLWGAAIGSSFVVGALLSYGFQHIHHAALASWRILFVVLGCVSVVFGLALFWLLPDTPMEARYLTDAEKVAVLQYVAANKTGVRCSTFKFSQLVEIIRDPQIWMLTILTTMVMLSTGFTLSYTAPVIAGFGFSAPNAALLVAPGGVVTLLSSWAAGFLLNMGISRAVVVAAVCVPVIIGAALLAFAPVTNRAASLAGIYLVGCSTAAYCVMYQWASANTAGQTKRTATMGLITAGFAAGALIAPQTFLDQEAPRFMSAKITLFATQLASLVLAGVMGAYYLLVNQHRNSRHGSATLLQHDEAASMQAEAWENLTDRERKSFRYMP